MERKRRKPVLSLRAPGGTPQTTARGVRVKATLRELGVRPLLALPVEHVLATHGGPTDRAALERALSSS